MRIFHFFNPGRLFWPAVLGLLAYLAAVQIQCVMLESLTADEPVVLAAGYSYLKTGDFRMEPANPPLAKMFAALPLLRFGISPPRDPGPWLRADEGAFAARWFEANARKEDAIVFAARLSSVLLTSCLGLAMALWARSVFGPAAALLALTLYAFDPTVTAHGHYVKNDLPLALFAFLACIAFAAYLKRPGLRRLLLAAIALGMAMSTKFSAVFLLPVFILMYAVWLWLGHKTLSLRRGIFSLAAVAALAGCVVFLVYELSARSHGVQTGGIDSTVIRALFDRSPAGVAGRSAGPPMAAHPFFRGLLILLDLNTQGHPSYLLGEVRTHGWWYYFPIAFAVKMPAATLAFLALAACVGLPQLRRRALRRVAFDWFVLAIPIAVFLAFTVSSPFDIGIRYLLPAWPFLFILAAALVTRARWRPVPILALVLLAGLAAESISIYPHYLAFFNFLAGGPGNGPRILADSNLDWGQDARYLAGWLREHPTPRLCLDYWGSDQPARFGVTGAPVFSRLRAEGRLPEDCIAAVSTNFLYGLSADHGEFGWLRGCPAEARIGYSIDVFDLAKCVPLARSRLAGAIRPVFRGVQHGNFRGALTAADPGRAGESLVFYMTGLGPVSPRVAPGRRAPLDVLSRVDVPLVCQWNAAGGGPMADITFAGLAPGQTGVYQVNILVPQHLASGEITCRSALSDPAQSASMAVALAP